MEIIVDNYPFQTIETKWRLQWEKDQVNSVRLTDDRKKLYVLVMFSYPSDKKLHIGHWFNYGPTDTFARFRRMNGWNVFEPMGFDAFGLPAENYAIKHNVHPATITRESLTYITEQIKFIGAMYDWNHTVDTSHPEYYKWTQWLFLQLFKTGAAYRKRAPVNWCPKCMTVLANEQVKADGGCDRCDTKVTTRDLEQWFFRITDFADALLAGLKSLDWPEATKAMQRHWIGRSEGTEIVFPIVGHDARMNVFTTRADTLFGVTYVVLAPEHELVFKICAAERRGEVEQYLNEVRSKSDIERLNQEREKTGVFTGAYAINPATQEKVPIWISDYVLASYGSGAVMAVPGHDQRDFEFAQKFKLPVRWVIRPLNCAEPPRSDCAFEDYGVMMNSVRFDGLTSATGKEAVTNWLKDRALGKSTVSYRLRDWLISRQRYWGAPIPIIHCPDCGCVPVPEEELPVTLPEEAVDFKPKGTSPLGACEAFMAVKCPRCGKEARRDPDTMDTFVDSSWYFLRYPSTDFHNQSFDPDRTKRWLPVDVYVGGPEHATGHLIYARYITHYLNSLGLLDFKEPFQRLVHQGIITYQGMRMSKSKGNVVNPDEFVEKFGADCFRLYLMFMSDYIVGGDWSDDGIIGVRRFQNRVWRLVNHWASQIVSQGVSTCDIVEQQDVPTCESVNSQVNRAMHTAIKCVTGDIERFQFNTAISRLMEFVNELYLYTNDETKVDKRFLGQALRNLVLLLGPLAPHIGEELWQIMGERGSLFDASWPTWDENALKAETVTIAVQINGKMTERMEAVKGIAEREAIAQALDLKRVKRLTEGKRIKRTIWVQDKIINLVI
ncbi:MAG: leucine--tRNA ligase [Calditrichota bacterium]